jgi:protoheme IX farnesyltransferase
MSAYFSLTKPPMVLGNTIVAIAAFLFASPIIIDWQALALLSIGFSFIIASACVFNNYYDRAIDALMERTKTRAIPSGSVILSRVFLLGYGLLLSGSIILLTLSTLVLSVALVGYVTYVCAYTPFKHRSSQALYVGAFAGAMPPVVGYAAGAGLLDGYALLFFIFLFVWQIPHFLAISVYRFNEYAAAGIPLLVHKGPYSSRERKVARAVFYISLVVLLFFCLCLMLHRWTR